MKTIDIKGKPYVTVNERLKHFRETFPDHSLITDIISSEDGICIIKAVITNKEGRVLATGHAYEKEGSTFINKTSHLENCETSAWGRALGNFGIGIDTSVASAEEVANAIKQQSNSKTSNSSKETTRELKKEIANCEKLADIKKLRDSMSGDERTIYSKLMEGRAYEIRLKMMDENFGKELNKLTKPNFLKNYTNIEAAIDKATPDDKKEMIRMYEYKIKEIGVDHTFASLPF